MTGKITLLFALICICLPNLIQSQNDDDDSDLLTKRAFSNALLCFDSGIAYLSNKRQKLGKQENVDSPNDCKKICSETTSCLYWTWIRRKRKSICKLASGVRKNNFRRKKNRAVAGTLLNGCNPVETPECGLSSRRIVGGEDANVGEWPWAAIVGTPSGNGGISVWCGGSLISNSVVLTAAHCFEGSSNPTIVRLGELDYTSSSDGAIHQDIEIAQVIMHPSYDSVKIKNDIAILKLKTSVDYTAGSIRPVCLPTDYTGPMKIEDLRNEPSIIGWGKLDDDLPLATTLQKATVPIVSNSNCNSDYNPGGITIDENSQICAGLGQIDTCAGDSGGPMLSNELSPLKRYAVIGITSFGVKCADPDYPGVYTRVDNYLDWIAQHL